MAESLLEGNAEAVPLEIDGKLPCTYCEYVNICDNSELERKREPDPVQIEEAEKILGKKYTGKEE